MPLYSTEVTPFFFIHNNDLVYFNSILLFDFEDPIFKKIEYSSAKELIGAYNHYVDQRYQMLVTNQELKKGLINFNHENFREFYLSPIVIRLSNNSLLKPSHFKFLEVNHMVLAITTSQYNSYLKNFLSNKFYQLILCVIQGELKRSLKSVIIPVRKDKGEASFMTILQKLKVLDINSSKTNLTKNWLHFNNEAIRIIADQKQANPRRLNQKIKALIAVESSYCKESISQIPLGHLKAAVKEWAKNNKFRKEYYICRKMSPSDRNLIIQKEIEATPNITNQKLAEVLGCTRQTVSKYKKQYLRSLKS
ncbi:hypothetical protein [Reichenbachiella agariperforans]|uniref:hypothetical protein n=1 Tax=Reichenbachiella agariperforans TaxID=156994 RepID=UPI001C09FECC|nr:hypothetical protein [Reichenbachiella agariperforans]MBU2915968.1 hypothetical protein [Reichenbachiella agariperforans]